MPLLRLASVAAALGFAACGGDNPSVDAAPIPAPDADPSAPDAAKPDAGTPREVIMETTPTLVPGELVEGIMTGGPNDFAVIYLTSPTEIDWNIHGHANGGTQTLVAEFNVMTVVDHKFVPTDQADWYLLIRNSGATAVAVDVRVELYEGMSWQWQD
jgi:hypothetical protein